MTQEEVRHLAKLARIELTEQEIVKFAKEMSAVLDYVSKVKQLAGEDDVSLKPTVGARYNVFRPDLVTNEPEAYTKELLAEMPKTEGRYLVVKKILQTD